MSYFGENYNGCPGSGKRVPHVDRFRDTSYGGYGAKEGFRTTCPDCGKVCAITPTGQVIQKHYPMKPKPIRLNKAEKEAARLKALDVLYNQIYDYGAAGESVRPNSTSPAASADTLDTWIMAYMDGLADGGHNMKLGAFKRWLAKN